MCIKYQYTFLKKSKLYRYNVKQEKKLVAEIKRTAKTGNEVSCVVQTFMAFCFLICSSEDGPVITNTCFVQATKNILARQLVRLRQQIANLQSSRAQMRGIATNTQAYLQMGISLFS